MPNVYISKPHHRQETRFSCVPACVKTMLEFHGVHVSEKELRKKLNTRSFGTYLIDVLAINREPYGVRAKIDFWSLQQLMVFLEEFQTPCIVPVWTEFLQYWGGAHPHVVIAHGFDDENFIINDPFFDEKEFHVPHGRFTDAWYANDGLIVTFDKEE